MENDLGAALVLRSGPGVALTEGLIEVSGYRVRLKHALPDTLVTVTVQDADGLLGLHRYKLVGVLPLVEVVDKRDRVVGAGSLEDCYQAAVLASCERCDLDIVHLLREVG